MTLTDKARAGFASITLRGGRITKLKGQAASYSPQLGSLAVGVSGAALASALAFTPGAAVAGECVQIDADEFLCAGPATPADATETISVGPIPLTVTTSPGFGHSVTSGPGIVIESAGDYGKFEDLNNSTISHTTFGVDMASNGRAGLLRFRSTGSIAGTATGSIGIDLSQNAVGLGISATTNNSTGDARGIRLTQNGYGSAILSSNGTASGTGAEDIGISAFGGTDSDTFLISARVASGTLGGIVVTHDGASGLELRSTESATGQGAASRGIDVAKSRGNTLIEANNTQGGEHAIRANTAGSYLTIRSSGLALATASDSAAISVNHAGAAVSISANNSTGGQYGIEAINEGTSALSVTSSGLARATSTTIDPLLPNGPTGIFAQNAATGTNLTILSNNATGHRNGIRAINNGTGMLSITSVEDEDGNRIGTARGTTGDAIFAENTASGIGITIAVTGGFAGINAINRGRAVVPADSTATDGLTITANNSTGGQYGIRAINEGSGTLSVTSTGLAQATSQILDPYVAQSGISARNDASGSSLTITSEDTSGFSFGITAYQSGSGDTTITSDGMASGGNAGIRVGANAGNVAITANDTFSERSGIEAYNNGSGDLTITSNGSINVGQRGINASLGDGDLTIETAAITTSGVGIVARSFGAGTMAITATGLINSGTDGIYARAADATAGDLTVSAENVSAGNIAINAQNLGTGKLVVSASGVVSSINDIGVLARAGGSELTVEVADAAGRRYGIDAINSGTGALTITASGTVEATGVPLGYQPRGWAGIIAQNNASGIDLLIDVADVSGNTYGIKATNQEQGALSIASTGDLTATGTAPAANLANALTGIDAVNSTAGTALTIEFNNATGQRTGIRAINNGTGMLAIMSVEDDDGNRIGTALAASGTAIAAENTTSGIGISIAVNDAISGVEEPDGGFTGGFSGIAAINRGTAAVPVGSTATNGLTITANNVTGGQFGIRAVNEGSGALTVTSTGTAIGAGNQGILAQNLGSGTDLTVNANNTSGGINGIYARNDGSGALTINSAGTATGTAAATISVGIQAFHYGAGDASITAEDTIGNFGGIRATSFGTGALTITSTGTATATGTMSGFGAGVYAAARTGDIAITANHTQGLNQGILVRSLGRNVTITSNGDAVATIGAGISIRHSGTGDAVISANNTAGAVDGIFVRSDAGGALTISSNGTARGTTGSGIFAETTTSGIGMTIAAGNAYAGTLNSDGSFTGGVAGINATNRGTAAVPEGSTANNGLRITANNVSGGQYGIRAVNEGTRALTITLAGSATGTALDGIYASNSAAASTVAGVSNDTTVIAADSTGGRTGIRALHEGPGAVSVTSTGLAEGTGSESYGIYARGRNGSSGVTVDSKNASGERFGILARNGGGGVLTVTSTGLAQGGSDDGINAATLPGGGATDILVSALDTSGGRSGLRVIHNGSGVIRVDSKGHASGARFRGISVGSGVNGSDVTVNAASATGDFNGIFVGHYGAGTVTVTAAGDITGANALVAANAGDNTRVTAVNTIGNGVGIFADARGNGVVEVVSTGTASASDARGRAIDLSNRAAGTAISLASNNAVGGLTWIRARNAGVGAITILSSGNAVGEAEDGILAINEASATNITITANTTRGGITGINAQNDGIGALAITTSGATTGTAQTGIDALNRGTSLAITTAGAVTGGVDGIRARNYGTAGLTIIANADVTGTAGAAINAFNSANDVTASMLVEQGEGTSFTGATDGITADNAGGSLTVNALGTLTGTTGSGVNAINQATATGMTLRVNNANGAVSGIAANNQGSGAADITLTGTVQGGSGAGIDTASAAGNLTTITLVAGAQALAGASGVAVANNEGNANLGVAEGASLVGEVRMGGGSDTATLAGAGALAGLTVLDGGDDIDALTLNGVVATLAADRIINWENVAIAASSAVSITGLTTDTLSVTVSTAVLTDLVAGRIISSNAQLTLGGATSLAGLSTCGAPLTVGGATAIGSGGLLGCAAADAITVTDDARVAGNIEGAGGSDIIAVLGNASITGTIFGGGAG